ncbi:MAG: LysR family transcriptional regulator [Archangium sp.]|nr:LysR family transcriptional regulator [Archangium sp.]
MHVMDFDLNLLKTLHALLETRSVTNAAKRVGLSQPAASHALARLRDALGDPLLVRAGSAQVLTERAERLKDPVKETLARAALLLAEPDTVRPERLVRNFSLSMADYTELVLLPPLTERLSAEAPGVSVSCRPHFLPLQALSTDAELWLGVNAPDHPGLVVQRLFSDSYLSVIRKDHPLARKKVTLRQFVELKHVQIAPGGLPGGPLDDSLAARGLSRTVSVRVPNFLVAPLLISKSDLVLTAPKRVVERFADFAGLHVFEPPIHVAPFTVQQAWLAKYHADPAHRWFRGLVKASSNLTSRAP